MDQDLLMTYKLGWKTSYYQNTYDAKKDIDESSSHSIGFTDNVPEKDEPMKREEFKGTDQEYEDYCESCTI